jgi:uncharacterized protein YhdP
MGPWKSGHVVFGGGKSDCPKRSGIWVNGHLEQWDVGAWWDILQPWLSSNGWSENINSNVRIDRLTAMGFQFPEVWLSTASQHSGLWTLEGPAMQGTLQLPVKKGSGIALKLNTLRLASQSVIPFNHVFLRIPIFFQCDDLTVGQANFGKVSLKLSPTNYGYAIDPITIESTASILRAKGEWHQDPYSRIQGEISGQDLGKTSIAWNLPGMVRDAKGSLKFNLQWPNHFFQWDRMASLTGVITVKMGPGRILGVDPGLGRIIGLLSVENIQRRLQFNFKDVFAEGLIFDQLKGDITLDKGKAITKDFLLESPSAKIQLTGDAVLENKHLNLDMYVIPKGASGIPIAAALAAGNPAIGAGVWLVDKLMGSNLDKITAHRYYVAGTWEMPIIQERKARIEK